VEKLEELYDMGVRGASLTWSRENALAKGCCRAGEKIQIRGGLTEKGIKAVEELERLSMFLDISHLNDDGFADVRQVASKPFCATHSCAKPVYDNYRNLTDEQMEALAEQGGVMGLNGCKYIAGSLSGNHLEMLCRHAEYEVGKAGAAGVGFGFDLCDSYTEAERQLAQKLSGSAKGKALPEKEDCFLSHAQIPLLTAALLERGMEEDTLKGILGGNFFRYFESTL
jgi:membrane dipeptidase